MLEEQCATCETTVNYPLSFINGLITCRTCREERDDTLSDEAYDTSRQERHDEEQ